MANADILSWDWRYQIGLKPELKRDVLEKVNILPAPYKKLYEEFIAYFAGMISMDVILESLLAGPGQTWEELGLLAPDEVKGKLLYIPPLLQSRMEEKIHAVKEERPELHDVLDNLYEVACTDGLVPDYRRGFDILFGDYLADVLTHAQRYENTRQSSHKDKLDAADVLPFAKRILGEITENEQTMERFGPFDVKEYEITLREQDHGFAEWWAKEINDKNVDELVLILNENSLNEQDLELTLYHEVYPGHGHFYEYARNKRKHTFFDHGAFSLIEGWATYVEWHAVELPHVHILKKRAAKHLQLIKEAGKRDESLIFQDLYEKEAQESSQAQASYSLLYFSQYPGYIESYYLGAFWLEMQLENGVYDSPFDFLQVMKTRPWGDFFTLW